MSQDLYNRKEGTRIFKERCDLSNRLFCCFWSAVEEGNAQGFLIIHYFCFNLHTLVAFNLTIFAVNITLFAVNTSSLIPVLSLGPRKFFALEIRVSKLDH